MNEIDKFISSIDNTLYNKIRQSKSDAECRRYLKEHFRKQLTLQVVGFSETELVCNRINDNNSNRCINCGVKAGHPCGLKTN